jgi:hypothetical protein
MIRVIFLIFLSWNLSSDLVAQVYENDYDFLLKKIEKVYAGYNDKVDKLEFQKLVSEVRNSKSTDTFAVLSKITSYFNDTHLLLFKSSPFKNIDTGLCSSNLKSVQLEITTKSKGGSPLVGYWVNDVGGSVIYLREAGKNLFEGILVETKRKYASKGACIMKFYHRKGKFSSIDYLDVDENARYFTNGRLKSKQYLILGAHAKWKKLEKFEPGILQKISDFNFVPQINKLDSNTILFSMPDFSGGYVKIYDSLIKANQADLTRCKTLIIDIRNNLGGTARCFRELVQYICVKPILTVETFKLASEDLIENARKVNQNYIDKSDTVKANSSKVYLTNLIANRDSFLYSPPDTIACGAKTTSIKNIGILTNNCTRSAAELMVLYLRDIPNLKVFGDFTGGAVDYLDILNFKMPISKYGLWIASAKRKITSNAPAYDNIGIKPDIPISDDEPDWVNFVKRYYEK